MNTETAALQAEISRLNVIISVLIEKNQQLQQELQSLKMNTPSQQHCYVRDEVSQNYVQHKTDRGEDLLVLKGKNNIRGELLHRIECNQIIPSENLQEPERNNNILGGNEDGIKGSETIPGGDLHGTECKNNILGNESWTESSTDSTKPAMIDSTVLSRLGQHADIYKLDAALRRSGMPQVPVSGVMNFARSLKLLAETPKPSYAIFRNRTGLTDSGVNKMIASMKRRKLIVRTEQNKYHLTEKAVKLLREAGEEVQLCKR